MTPPRVTVHKLGFENDLRPGSALPKLPAADERSHCLCWCVQSSVFSFHFTECMQMDVAHDAQSASPGSLADPQPQHEIEVHEDVAAAAADAAAPPPFELPALPPALAVPSWPLRVHAQLEPTSTGSRNYFSLALPPALAGFIGASEYAHSITRINSSIRRVQRQRVKYGLLSVGLLVLVVVLNQSNVYSGSLYCDASNPCRMPPWLLSVFLGASLLWIALKDLTIHHSLTYYFPRSVEVESELMYERSPRVMELVAMGARPAQLNRPWPIQWRGLTSVVPRPPFNIQMDVEIEVGAPFAQQVAAPGRQQMQV